MNRNWILGIMIAMIGLCVLWWLRGYMVSYAVLENHSGQSIAHLEIKVLSRTIRHRDINNGETRWGTFYLDEEAWVASNGRIELSGTLADGTVFRSINEAPIVSNGRVRAVYKVGPGGKIDFSY